ncbi:MAG: hypothetical protein KGZ39_00575 [Simkania sp.]|nr:hypothetical protein [Simkania sp.]
MEILDTGSKSAEENMRIDADLLGQLAERKDPVLHLYDWRGKCATYGCLTNPQQYLDLKQAEREQLQLAKRSTGGGIVFHLWDLAFSVVIPSSSSLFSQNTLTNYSLVNHMVLKAVETFTGKSFKPTLAAEDSGVLDASCKRFCMAQPTQYDVVWNGQKIAGAAQRQTKYGFLHQGTISLRKPDFSFLSAVISQESRVLEAMRANTWTLLPEEASEKDYQDARTYLKQLLSFYFTKL